MVGNDRTYVLHEVRREISRKNYSLAFAHLYSIARPSEDFSVQHKYAILFKSIVTDRLELKPIKIAIVSTSTIEHFANVFSFWMAICGFNAQLYFTEYNTIDQNILNPSSDLYVFKPDIVWIFSNYRDVNTDLPYGCDVKLVGSKIDENIDRFAKLWSSLRRYSTAYIIQNNADLPIDRIFGNFESNINWGRANFLRKYNYRLFDSLLPGITLFDIDYISSLCGKHKWFDERYWYHSKHAFSLDAIGLVAFHAAKLVAAIKGQSKKCLVLDLDNTLWGGVIGDDGLEGIKLGDGVEGEAFSEFQKYIKMLKNRGIILAVCSKNDEENAKLPFIKHPCMHISLNDIAVFVANWGNKPDNIKKISEVLNIGLDSMVFVDDNPVERDVVRNALPMVSVPEMPGDPSYYVRTLNEQLYFELISFSNDDVTRNDMYRENILRHTLKDSCTDLTQYLQSLRMKAFVDYLDRFHLPRIAQLINKSNQFHLTTTRYTETELMEMMEEKNIICRFYKLKDRFGDNGLISVVILRKGENGELYVDTWVMSCRVIARGMEHFVYNDITAIAKELNCVKVLGHYKPTKKNKLVAEHYNSLGFVMVNEKQSETFWELNVDKAEPIQMFIEPVSIY
ncbi:MAG: HAD-IIIC family phosphatase [Coxiellaceae bacterium]|jgi:FkbH-like protein|nr:HAD-IIIC family phosphatase [Coxiellaceae bacterium]